MSLSDAKNNDPKNKFKKEQDENNRSLNTKLIFEYIGVSRMDRVRNKEVCMRAGK